MRAPSPPVRRRWRRWLFWAFAIVLAMRVALPYVLLHVANKRLASLPAYRGRIVDLDLHLLRGAYQLEGFHLNKMDSTTAEETPFIAADLIDLSVEWKALLHGALVAELDVDRAMLRFTKDKTEPGQVQQDTASLGDLLHDFMPLRIDRLNFTNSRLEYLDEGSTPPVDLAITDLFLTATNLTSVVQKNELLPARIVAYGGLYGGRLRLSMGLDALARQACFDSDLTLEGMDLARINDFFVAYAGFDVNKGSLDVYSELVTRENAFKGYVKPIIKDLDVLGREDRKDKLFQKVKEALVAAAGSVLKNPKEQQVASKIPLEGRLDDPAVRSWDSIIMALRNAFIEALQPSIDGEIDLGALRNGTDDGRGFFKRLFGKDKDEE